MKIKTNFGRSIVTKYLGATNSKGSRVKAIDGNRSVTIAFDDSLNTQKAHFEAVKALCEKYEYSWGNDWGMTCTENQTGYIFFSMKGWEV